MTTKTSPLLSFAKLETGMPMPHLLDIQTRAFQSLLQPDGKDGARADVGLERVFKDLFPIQDVNGNYSLEFVKYALGEPKYTVEECIERDMTYSVPLKATLQLVVMEEVGEVTKTKRPKNIIEKEVYLGELPILTPLGTFVINGAERVIVSQLHRSPGVVFEESIHPNGQRLFSARIIPFRGSWVEFTIDIHDVIYVHIDKKKKFPATALLRAFGYGTNADILKLFYAVKDIDITGKLEGRAQKREVLGTLLATDVPDPENKKGEPLARVGDELVLERFNAFRRAGITSVKVFAGYTSLDLREDAQPTTTQQTPSKYVLAFDVADPDGEIVGEAGRELSDTLRKKLLKADVTKVDVLLPPGRSESPLIKNTLAKDPTHAEAEALAQIYTLLRPGEAPNIETAREALKRLFFHPKRYDLGRVGRYKINQRLKVNVAKDNTVLTEADFVAIIRYLIELSEGRGYTDDIDHLGNRRVRSVGELIANQFSVGLSRMARLIKERMSINNDPERITLDDLVNARTVSAVIQAFFGSSQLSQFMDQTNPLAELTHKRRLSALGPGGLTRERAGFEVRDVHYSQYGRMCPIETPEGPNIGLITSLSCYARVNDLGFIETPYRVVKDGKVTDETRWLSASEEEDYAVAQANAHLTPDGRFADELVLCRKRDDYPLLPPNKIDFMDVAPEQLVSIAAALIPFLEHDDANRALMGSNMQRQSVPLLFPQAPLVGTGLEEKVARDSGAVVIARRGGVVTRVTADEIIIDAGDEDAPSNGDHPLARLKQHDRFRLKKFWRTNQDTAINQRPLVHMGQKVKAGQIVADGAGTERGDLALGANVTVAFMPWYGHNFEDAIVLSERLVKDDVYSSIHIQELELHVRDTKRGREEITREIPNVAEESLVDLDERGIVRIGAHVKAGDILVGKITPKGETELSPEEKLLTAIFGEKAKDVKDSSLKVPPGMEGVVIDVKIFSRIEDQVVEKDRGERIGDVRRLETEEKARISEAVFTEVVELLANQEVGLMLKAGTVEEYLPAGTKLSRQQLGEINFADVDLKTLRVANKAVNEKVRAVLDAAGAERAKIEEKSEDQIDKILQPDELPPGVIQLVKVYVAEKRKISVGDKMAGRHGNKGIIARIVPEEDMPFLPNGTPVDIVLNPLGVPSRMNVGQILETHLGWAANLLGFDAKTPVFQGANETEIGVLLRLAGLTWAADSLRLDVRPPALDSERVLRIVSDLQRLPATNGDRPDIGTAGVALLGGRSVSAETRELHHQMVDFLKFAGKELAERELAQRRIEQEVHAAKLEAAEASNLSAAEKAALKAGAKEIEKGLAKDKPAEVLEATGRPALAALFGAKSEADVDAAADELLAAAGLSPVGKCRLRDGRTGELFESEVTVGSIYMMKLSHLVDDKIHARSIGPYSLVTQQPLAGKAQFGGQRFGEMEVWALEAYGAAHTLQEILTVKSDDVNGRSRVYEAIVKGQNLPKPGIPESFNVLVKELQALGLKVTLGTTEDVEE
ncbi:MAG TPA: DNA-directed RNA polymerase subunit beta [Gemmatimonadales bacterium]|nr:DNA-directed RNA polymerase subunit beta [Gemmatimonadales bacterium]